MISTRRTTIHAIAGRWLVVLAICAMISGCVVTRYSTTGVTNDLPPSAVTHGQDSYDDRPWLRGDRWDYTYRRQRLNPRPGYREGGYRDWRPERPQTFFPEHGVKCNPRRAVCYKWDEHRDRWRPDRSETRDFFGKKAAKRLKR
jgi:hypothetical protein